MGIEIAFAAALVVFVGAIFWLLLKKSSDKIGMQFSLLAEKYSLELDQPEAKLGGLMRPEPSLYGNYRGRELSIAVPGKGLQNTRQIETVLKVEVKNDSLRAQLTAAGPLGGMRQRDSGGQPRWKSGDVSFDDAVDIRTNHGDTVGALLDDNRKKWLARTLRKSKATLYIGGGNLAYARLGLIADDATREEFEAATEFLCDLAETLEA